MSTDFNDLKTFDAPDDEIPDFKATPSDKPNPRNPFKPKTRSKPETKKPTPAPRYSKGMFVEPLTQLYGMVGMAVMTVDPPVGKSIMMQATACAESLDELAKSNVQVRKVLVSITQGSAWSGVAVAHMPILLALLVNHVPSMRKQLEVFGVTDERGNDESGSSEGSTS